MFLDCRHVCKTFAFRDALQAGKQKEVHRTPLIWCLRVPDQGSKVGLNPPNPSRGTPLLKPLF
jgi:hypothetical protein